MIRSNIILVVFCILALFSCSSLNLEPEDDNSILVFYVEEFHKPITKPSVYLHVEGQEQPYRLDLKTPAAAIRTTPTDEFHATGWSADKGTTLKDPGGFYINAPAGRISLAPYKIQIIGKTQIEVKPLTYLDLEYAKGRFAQNNDFDGLDILYPEIPPE